MVSGAWVARQSLFLPSRLFISLALLASEHGAEQGLGGLSPLAFPTDQPGLG